MKKGPIFFAFVIIMLMFSGCTSKASDMQDLTRTKDAQDPYSIDTSKFVTINLLVLGDPQTNGQLEKVKEKWNELLKEKMNASLELFWIDMDEDVWAKYNLALASGYPYDLIITSDNWLNLWQNVQRGAFMDITELLPIYAPKTWAEIPPEDWAVSKYKNQIVAIPEDNYTLWVNHGLWYRADWARELGVTKPITNWDTMERYLQGIKDTKKDVWPIDTAPFLELGWYNSHTAMIPNYELGFEWFGKSYEEKYIVVNGRFDPSYLDFAKKMKQWADKGFWRPDILTYKGDSLAAFKAGKTAVYQHNLDNWRLESADVIRANPGAEVGFFPFYADTDNLISQSVLCNAISVGANSKNPEKALMAYDLLRHDRELYMLFHFGIEGVHYEIQDGKMTEPKGYHPERDSFYTNFWGGRMDAFTLPNVMDNPLYPKLSEYQAGIAKPYPYTGFILEDSITKNERAAIENAVSGSARAILYGQVNDPEEAVWQLRAAYEKYGLQRIVEDFQTQLNVFKKQVEGE